MLLWKTLLACLGGQKDIARVKALVREVEGLPPDTVDTKHCTLAANALSRLSLNRSVLVFTKVSPSDLLAFRSEIIAKYPTYVPPSLSAPIPQIPLDHIAAASAPLPLRMPYPHHNSAQHDNNQQNQPPPGAGPLPPTPAPSPPPSPVAKPKKQQFQTDQGRPFVLPFSKANFGNKGRQRFVPRSIDEAGDLYRRNIRISTDLWQTVKLREECIADESGTSRAEADLVRESDVGTSVLGGASTLDAAMADLHIRPPHDDGEANDLDPLQMLERFEKDTKSQQLAAEASGNSAAAKKLGQKALDIRRLQRIEMIYVSFICPVSSS